MTFLKNVRSLLLTPEGQSGVKGFPMLSLMLKLIDQMEALPAKAFVGLDWGIRFSMHHLHDVYVHPDFEKMVGGNETKLYKY